MTNYKQILIVFLILSSLVTSTPAPLVAQAENPFLELELNDLMQVKVTSVSRREENIGDSSAAIYILTEEDIRRSGARHIPDALRLVPGVSVRQVGSSSWAISIRGLSDLFANKLLVMVDGRSIYTPAFAGVYWEAHNIPLEEVERIEVIRGPGASMWGANAVNGVINIITKHTRDTLGTEIVAGGGNVEQNFTNVRTGGELSENWMYRGYGNYNRTSSAELEDGGSAGDAWEHMQTGFRADGKPNPDREFSLHGNVFKANLAPELLFPTSENLSPDPKNDYTDHEGISLLASWDEKVDKESNLKLQFFYDFDNRDSQLAYYRRNTFDIDIDYKQNLDKDTTLLTGINYRVFSDDTRDHQTSFDPKSGNFQLIDTMLQLDHSLSEDIKLTLGTKLGYNDFSELEVQPSARALWKVTPKQSIWTSFSRAVRTPSRAESGVTFPVKTVDGGPVPVLATLVGNDSVESEELLAYELGYRAELFSNKLFIDVALYYNDYHNLLGAQATEPELSMNGTPYIDQPFVFNNVGAVDVHGFEAAMTWRPVDAFWVKATYAYQNYSIDFPGQTEAVGGAPGDYTPHSATLQAHWNLASDWELDSITRYTDSLSFGDRISSYIEMDLRLAYHWSDDIELSVVGRNLLNDNHSENIPPINYARQIVLERSVFGNIRYSF